MTQPLPKVEMKGAAIQPGELYIWDMDGDRQKVVWLNDEQDGINESDGSWYFEDNLIGQLYGPLKLAE